jgi:DNA repair protein RadC
MIYLKDSKIKVKNTQQVAKLFLGLLQLEDEIDRLKEHFYVMHLDTRSRVNMIELVTLGTLTSSLVHPRETFRRAILQGDASVIVAHNHPSGDPGPSDEDMKVTKLLLDAGKLIGITVLDHIVFSKDKYYSFRDCEQGNIIDETYKKGGDNV